jgi:hypothetical protein
MNRSGRTLEESEAKLREIIAEDPLCLGVGGGKAGVKGIMEGMESFDDRADAAIRVPTDQ